MSMFVSVSVIVSVYGCPRVFVYLCLCEVVCIFVRLFVCLCICVCMCLWVCMRVFVFVCGVLLWL